MNIWAIVGALFFFLLSLLGIQTRRIDKQKGKLKKTEEERDSEKIKVKVEQHANEIKDELVIKKEENSKEKAEELEKVDQIEGGELSEEEKAIAAAQSERAAARARKLSERSKGN
jgi:predicted RND superfamily exporter protein